MPESWYRDGLYFQCKKCGRCCTGEPGYVWLSEQDITKIAKELAMDRALFEKNFVKGVPRLGKSLIEFENGDCALFNSETKMCRVYQSRPIQCKTWPFWYQNLDVPDSWTETAKSCPGCNQGTLVTQEQIESQAAQTKLP